MSAILLNKAIVAQYLTEIFENVSGDRLQYLLSDDFRSRTIAASGADCGPEDVAGLLEALRRGFSGTRVRIEELLAEGEAVGARYTFEAEHTGEFAGVPASGRHVTVPGILVARLRDGRIAECWRQEDQLGLLRQLGVDVGELVAA